MFPTVKNQTKLNHRESLTLKKYRKAPQNKIIKKTHLN